MRPFSTLKACEILSFEGSTIENINDFLGRARHQNNRTIIVRRDSFAAWPTDINVDIHHMAVSGFYYLGKIS